MTCDVFIRSYEKDFEWLTYCLRSLAKFAHGFREIVIAVPTGHELQLDHLTRERIVTVNDAQPGYMAQQVTKLTADLHTNADFILHIDSDTILTRPVSPDDFLMHGKPNWLITPWSVLHPDDKLAWYPVMTKCLLESPRFEFMRRNLMMIPRWAYGLFRDEIKRLHGIPMDAYVMNQPGHAFSEYNCLGFFLYLYHHDKVNWIDTTKHLFQTFEKQAWSWGGITPEIRAEIERILA
jgi:hypothetical protein